MRDRTLTPAQVATLKKVVEVADFGLYRVELFNFVENDHTGEYVGFTDEDERAFLDELADVEGLPGEWFEMAVRWFDEGVDAMAERAA
jgi:hypothetical protein